MRVDFKHFGAANFFADADWTAAMPSAFAPEVPAGRFRERAVRGRQEYPPATLHPSTFADDASDIEQYPAFLRSFASSPGERLSSKFETRPTVRMRGPQQSRLR
jgi:hypothetical protein